MDSWDGGWVAGRVQGVVLDQASFSDGVAHVKLSGYGSSSMFWSTGETMNPHSQVPNATTITKKMGAWRWPNLLMTSQIKWLPPLFPDLSPQPGRHLTFHFLYVSTRQTCKQRQSVGIPLVRLLGLVRGQSDWSSGEFNGSRAEVTHQQRIFLWSYNTG